MFIEVFYEIVFILFLYRGIESVGYKLNSEYILCFKEGGGF